MTPDGDIGKLGDIEQLRARVTGDIDRLGSLWRRPLAATSAKIFERAIQAMVDGEFAPSPPVRTANFVLVTKAPHAVSEASLFAILTRLIAYGIEIRQTRRCTPESAEVLARSLYPIAGEFYRSLPASQSQWDTLAATFGVPEFADIFGVDYSPDLVVPAHEVMQEANLTRSQMTEIWEEGRSTLTRAMVLDRYGPKAATRIFGGGDTYAWFRGELPIGIKRIASGLMAFALRHPRIREGRPTIVLNGHYPGLLALFESGAYAVLAGLSNDDVTVADVREEVVGDDNRPEKCKPGTIRYDAAHGILPTDSDSPPDSRHNVVHCSDGLVAGLIESRTIFGPTENRLGSLLREAGLTETEIDTFVLADPVVITTTTERLTALTRGLGVNECAETVLRLFPPTFGERNQYAFGVDVKTLANAFAGQHTVAYAGHRPLSQQPVSVDTLGGELPGAGALGQGAPGQDSPGQVGAGSVGLVVPVAGSGGRFGGYGLAESDIRRQKALLRQFRVGAGVYSPLELRVGNALYWRERYGTRVPVAIMASTSNASVVTGLCRRLNEAGLGDIDIYVQPGVFRLHQSRGPGRWFDYILREDDGRPSLKGAGNIGVLTGFAITGILAAWLESGVRYAAFANGDDVGFRVDPRILTYLDTYPEVDAVVVGVPWGVSGTVKLGSDVRDVRGDVSGWAILDDGRSAALLRDGDRWIVEVDGRSFELADVTVDKGGSLCEVHTDGQWRVGAVEELVRYPDGSYPVYSTNQMYIRLSSLDRVLRRVSPDVVTAVRTIVESIPARIENKKVRIGDREVMAEQFAQVANSLLPLLGTTTAMTQPRRLDGSGVSAYAPLKTPSDVGFAQLTVDRLPPHLLLPPVLGQADAAPRIG